MDKEKELRADMFELNDKFDDFLVEHGAEEGMQFLRLQLLTIGSALLDQGTHKETGREATEGDVIEVFDQFIKDTKRIFKKDHKLVASQSSDFFDRFKKDKDFPELTSEEMDAKAREFLKEMEGGGK